jgi:tetratricopeptide (TPR) repeat protein
VQQIVPRDRIVIEHEIELRLMQRFSHARLGLYRNCFKGLAEAERLAVELPDPRRLLTVRIAQLHLLGVAKTARQATQTTGEVVNLALSHGTAAEIAAAYFFDCQARWWSGLHRQALVSAQAGLSRLGDLPRSAWSGASTDRLVSLHTQMALNHTCLGAFDDALAHAEQARSLAEHYPTDYDISYAAYGLGWTLTHMGRAGAAIGVLQHGLAAAQRGEYATNCSILAGLLGWAYLVDGNADQAQSFTARALDAPESMRFLPAWHGFFRALVLYETGQFDAAESTITEVLRRGHRKAHRSLVLWAQWLIGRMTITHNPTGAIRRLRAAAGMAEQAGLRPLVGRCQDDIARAAWICQQPARALPSPTKAHQNPRSLPSARRHLALMVETGAET